MKIPKETRVSKKLSELTTRKVILVVLGLLFLLPLFETNLYFDSQTSFEYSIEQLEKFTNDSNGQKTTNAFINAKYWLLRNHENSRYPCIYIYSSNFTNLEY